jgi:uncharacterized protein (TIGR00730 family)
VTGIIPEFLIDMEATRHSLGQLNELIVTPDMHARKHTMFERSDAFVTLPGGIGTLEEIVEIMTWAQLGRHEKPMVFANINGFWDPMMELMRHMTDRASSTPPTASSRWSSTSRSESSRRSWPRQPAQHRRSRRRGSGDLEDVERP